MKEKKKESPQNRLFSIHSQIGKIFYFLITEVLLPVFVAILGVISWMYPVFNIWTDIVDGELTLLKGIGYLLVGVILFYTSLALYKLQKELKLNTENKS